MFLDRRDGRWGPRRAPDATLMPRFVDRGRASVRATAGDCRRRRGDPIRTAGLRRAGARGRCPGDDRLLALWHARLGLVPLLGRPAGLLAHLSRLAPALGAATLAVLSVISRRVGKAAK